MSETTLTWLKEHYRMTQIPEIGDAANELERLMWNEENCCGMNPEGVADLEARYELLRTERSNWMETAATNQRNTDFYRDLIVQIGETFGEAAKTSDDGSIQEDVLALKVPELVASLRTEVSNLELANREARKTIDSLNEIIARACDEKNDGGTVSGNQK